MPKRSPTHLSESTSPFLILGGVLLTAGLFYVRFGYEYGFSDQDEFIPLVLKYLNPFLLDNDWFISGQASSINVRTFFARLLFVIAQFFGVEGSVLVVHTITGGALIWVLLRLANRLYHNALTAIVFVVLVLVLTPRWNPGGNDVWHAMLVPSTLGWTLALWSWDRIMDHRFGLGGILMAFAMLVHPLIGLQLGCILGTALLMTHRKPSKWFLVPFLMVAIPSIWLFAAGGGVTDGELSSAFILTHLRAPHHYLPATFSAIASLKWSLLVVLGGGFLWTDRFHTSSGSTRNWILKLGGISLAVLAVGILFSTIVPVLRIISLQPFTLAVLIRIVCLLGVSAFVVHFIPQKATAALTAWVLRPAFPITVAVFLLGADILMKATTGVQPVEKGLTLQLAPVQNETYQDNGAPLPPRLDLATATWIQDNTPQGAVFAIPPSLSGFQTHARRAQYINFKAFPFWNEAAIEWLRRLTVIAPSVRVEASALTGGTRLLNQLDQSFLEQSPAYWNSVRVQENIDYLVRPAQVPYEGQTDSEMKLSPIAAWCSGLWCVYDLPFHGISSTSNNN